MLKIFPIDFIRQAFEQKLLKEHNNNQELFGGKDQVNIFSFYEQLKSQDEVDRFVENYRDLADQQNRSGLILNGVIVAPENPTITNLYSSLIIPMSFTCSMRCLIGNRDQAIWTINNLINKLKGRKVDIAQLNCVDEEGKKYTVPGTYSMPFMKSTEIMFYNMTLLQIFMPGFRPEVGSSETAIKEFMATIDWDTFMDLCEYVEAHRAEVSDTLEVAAWYDSDANFLVSKMFQNNIGYADVTDQGKGTILFADGENRTKLTSLLETLNTQYHANNFTTKGIKKTYGSDFFTGEKCVFSIGSSGGSGYNFPQAEAFELGVCRVPASNNNPLYVSQGPTLAIFNDDGLSSEKNTQTTLYAWKFLKYITNGQANAELCVNGSEGYAPVRYSAYETEFFQEFMEEGEQYAKCYDIIVNDINVNAGYLVSPAFKGSAALRDECGTLLTAAIKASDVAQIPGLIDRCISNARAKF